MIDGQGVRDVLTRVLEANLRYYEGMGRLTADYLRVLVGAFGDVRLPVRLGRSEPRPGQPPVPPRGEPTPSPAPPAIVLEAEGGGRAVGAFLVENRLPKRVSAPVVASSFVDPAGREVRPALVIEPDVVTLEPGEQILVRFMTTVGDDLEPGVSYRGELTVPGVWGGRVYLVLRRRPGAPPTPPAPPAGAPSSAPASAAPAASTVPVTKPSRSGRTRTPPRRRGDAGPHAGPAPGAGG